MRGVQIGSVEAYDCDAEDELEEAESVGDDEEGKWIGGLRGRFPGEARATEGHGWCCWWCEVGLGMFCEVS